MPSLKPHPLLRNLRNLQPFLLHHHHHRPLRPPLPNRPLLPHRTLIAPPTPNSPPLMTRRSDRALPPLPSAWRPWSRTLPLFLVLLTLSALAIFNYQKSSSSVVAATLYALRTSEAARRELGDEIYFRDLFPWVWGEMNQLHGRVDIRFAVKGREGRGWVRFRSLRRGRMGKFETKEWSLETEDGRIVNLLDEGKEDPFVNTDL